MQPITLRGCQPLAKRGGMAVTLTMAETKIKNMNAKILDVLTAKFGEDIIKILLNNGKIEISKFNESPVSFINARDKKSNLS